MGSWWNLATRPRSRRRSSECCQIVSSPDGWRRRRGRASSPGSRRRRSTRSGCSLSSATYTRWLTVRADQLKQALKNGVYRALGETATGVGAVNGGSERALVVLMYHKVNDTLGNSVTIPVSLFDEQMAQLGELGYTPVSLDDVLDYFLRGVPLPERAVLITFDDGYLDNLENAAPILRRNGYPAVLFVPIGYLGDPRPLPHDEHLA